jgi:hypothetical protein
VRQVAAGVACLILALGVFAFVAGPSRAASSYDSAYFGESAFLSLNPGQSGQFAVGFNNTGSTGWQIGTASQVDLQVCGSDKVTCGIPSANAAWASGWLRSTVYATTTTAYVGPGQTGFFVYNIVAPSNSAGQTVRFNGDLALDVSGQQLHPQGYYQDATVNAGPAATQVRCGPWATNPIVNNGSSTTSTTVSVADVNGNVVTFGTYSVSLSRLSGSSTVLVTTSPQSTSGGNATFTVRSSGVAGTDTYQASGTGLTANNCPPIGAQ